MDVEAAGPAGVIELARGDILALISDGVYEYGNDLDDELFGDVRVTQVLTRYQSLPLPELTAMLLEAVAEFGAGAAQKDDITLVLLRRKK